MRAVRDFEARLAREELELIRGLDSPFRIRARPDDERQRDGQQQQHHAPRRSDERPTWLPHHVAYVAPQESVQTVSVSTNNFDAEQGLAGGAAITVQTKSGTNDLHGAAFEYLQNSALNAKNFFTPTNQNNPKLIRNMYGGAFGGPIRKDKLFYFVSYEAMRERRSYAAVYTVATPEMKDGDFSATGVKLYDPATGAADGSGRTEFVGAKIPKNRISPVA